MWSGLKFSNFTNNFIYYSLFIFIIILISNQIANLIGLGAQIVFHVKMKRLFINFSICRIKKNRRGRLTFMISWEESYQQNPIYQPYTTLHRESNLTLLFVVRSKVAIKRLWSCTKIMKICLFEVLGVKRLKPQECTTLTFSKMKTKARYSTRGYCWVIWSAWEIDLITSKGIISTKSNSP